MIGHARQTGTVAVLIDDPVWPWRGRRWSHLVSDVSYEELHAFVAGRARHPAARVPGRPLRHPRGLYDVAVAAGAQPVGARELLSRLLAAGLRPEAARAAEQGQLGGQVGRGACRPLPGRLRRPVERGQGQQISRTAIRPAVNSSSERWPYSSRTAEA